MAISLFVGVGVVIGGSWLTIRSQQSTRPNDAVRQSQSLGERQTLPQGHYEGRYVETDSEGPWEGTIWIDVNASGDGNAHIWLPTQDGTPGIITWCTLRSEGGKSRLQMTHLSIGDRRGIPRGPDTVPLGTASWTLELDVGRSIPTVNGWGVSNQNFPATFSATRTSSIPEWRRLPAGKYLGTCLEGGRQGRFWLDVEASGSGKARMWLPTDDGSIGSITWCDLRQDGTGSRLYATHTSSGNSNGVGTGPNTPTVGAQSWLVHLDYGVTPTTVYGAATDSISGSRRSFRGYLNKRQN